MIAGKILVIGAVATMGCVGPAPGPGADAAPTHVNLSGTVRDVVTGEPIDGAEVNIVSQTNTIVADVAGAGFNKIVPVDTAYYFNVTKTGYYATNVMPVSVSNFDVIQDGWMASTPAVTAFHTVAGATVSVDLATVVVDLKDPQGAALAGVPLANLGLTGITAEAGPYFINANGALDINATESVLYNDRAIAVFLGVSPGTGDFSVTPLTGDPITSALTTYAGTVSVLDLAGTGTAPPPPQNLTFNADIAPMIQASCSINSAGCHGPGGNGLLDYAGITANYLDIPAGQTVAELLTEASNTTPHIGGAPWPIGSPSYETVLQWINQGAIEQ